MAWLLRPKKSRGFPQFSSERLSPFRRQAEVLSPMLKGTNFDKWHGCWPHPSSDLSKVVGFDAVN